MPDPISAISGTNSVQSDPVAVEISAPAAPVRQDAKPKAADDITQQRLVIEPVSSHRYIYKVLDSSTGQVLRQLPNEHVEKMITDPSYQEGKLVKTSA